MEPIKERKVIVRIRSQEAKEILQNTSLTVTIKKVNKAIKESLNLEAEDHPAPLIIRHYAACRPRPNLTFEDLSCFGLIPSHRVEEGSECKVVSPVVW